MIISASRRTDIPALYMDWFARRLQAGFVDVRNPFNRRQISRISLRREAVDCLVFWSKNPAPMLDYLGVLASYPYYVQVTYTPYGRDVETNLSRKEEILSSMIELSKAIGRERLVWRYDPILLTECYSVESHLDWFERTLEALAPYTSRCVFSFLDLYAKAKRNALGLGLREATEEEMEQIAAGLSRCAKGSGVLLQTCSEAIALETYDIHHGACIDAALIEHITGKEIPRCKAKSQRPLCGCIESFDIGAYDTCTNGCRYCYASTNPKRAQEGRDQHNPDSTLLTGELVGDEKITLHGGQG